MSFWIWRRNQRKSWRCKRTKKVVDTTRVSFWDFANLYRRWSCYDKCFNIWRGWVHYFCWRSDCSIWRFIWTRSSWFCILSFESCWTWLNGFLSYRSNYSWRFRWMFEFQWSCQCWPSWMSFGFTFDYWLGFSLRNYLFSRCKCFCSWGYYGQSSFILRCCKPMAWRWTSLSLQITCSYWKNYCWYLSICGWKIAWSRVKLWRSKIHFCWPCLQKLRWWLFWWWWESLEVYCRYLRSSYSW